jgi:hypothetical protein
VRQLILIGANATLVSATLTHVGARPIFVGAIQLIRLRAEGEEPAITVLHDKFARVPGRIAKNSCELYPAGGILGIQRVCVLDEQVGVEQLVGVFVRIRGGRRGEAEMNSVLVARDDGVDRRVMPRAQTFKPKLVPVIRESGSQVRGEELRRSGGSLRSTYHGV